MWSLIYLYITFFLKASYCIFPKWLPNHFILIISLHATFHFIIMQPLKDYKRKKKLDILCEQMNVWGPFTSKETNRQYHKLAKFTHVCESLWIVCIPPIPPPSQKQKISNSWKQRNATLWIMIIIFIFLMLS